MGAENFTITTVCDRLFYAVPEYNVEHIVFTNETNATIMLITIMEIGYV